jgi:hypothetical protein
MGVTFAVLRPDQWDFPLFLHVAGAMLLVGALVVVTVTMAAAARNGEGVEVLTRLAFRTLLLGVIPAYILMRVGAEWILSKEGLPDDLGWIGIGYGVADGGLLLAIIATVLAWRVARRGAARPGGAGRAVFVLAALLIVAYGVAIWAMATKPT